MNIAAQNKVEIETIFLANQLKRQKKENKKNKLVGSLFESSQSNNNNLKIKLKMEN